MGKRKCIEEFNPWPPFVDVFSSVILVMMLFLLITLANLGYYAQFKYKVSYVGSVATDNLILSEEAAEVRVDEIVKEQEINAKNTKVTPVQMQKQQQAQQSESTPPPVEEENKTPTERIEDLESAGFDFRNKKEQELAHSQKTVAKEMMMVVSFSESEVTLDNDIIAEIKRFIEGIRTKYPKQDILVSAFDPVDQISATVAKQISLARTLNTRNLIRKLGYKKNQVKVDLLTKYPDVEGGNKDSGYVIIKVGNSE